MDYSCSSLSPVLLVQQMYPVLHVLSYWYSLSSSRDVLDVVYFYCIELFLFPLLS